MQFEKGAGKQALKIASSKAIGSVIASIMASVPFPLNVALAVGANTIVGNIFDKIPAFEDGAENGFVGGNSFTGDRVLARVNSGEAVLNASQQRNFLDLATARTTIQSGSNTNSSSLDNLANKIEFLTDEIALRETNIDISNELNVTAEDLLEVNLQGERDKDRRLIV